MTNPKKQGYVYYVLRYVHDVIAGEFVNVGVVLYAPGSKAVRILVTASSLRISQVFPGCDSAGLRREFERIQAEFRMQDGKANSLDEIVQRVLSVDSTALQWSSMYAGISSNLTEAAEELFHRYVIRPGLAYDSIERLYTENHWNRVKSGERKLISSNDEAYEELEPISALRQFG